MYRPTKPLRFGLFGCPLDTGNAGVTALCYSILQGLANLNIEIEVLLFDSGRGERVLNDPMLPSHIRVVQVGCFHSRRYYLPTNLVQMNTVASLGFAQLHPFLKRLRQLDAILDISGGDSFSDIYGPWRFRAITLPKLIALQLRIPLILLPQTYGPYRDRRSQEIACTILRGAYQIWARDEHSAQIARSLLANTETTSLHVGKDVAFGLPSVRPDSPDLVAQIERLAANTTPLIGINVSGLLYNQPGEDMNRYGFRSPYRDIVHTIIADLLNHSDAQILLIPHVFSSVSSDCDKKAITSLYANFSTDHRSRILSIPTIRDARQIKWVIGRCSWFLGTRMHACIAALSQGIPTVAIAYSDKFRGVFASVGVEQYVRDPRIHDLTQLRTDILASYYKRHETVAVLTRHLPQVHKDLQHQFLAIHQPFTA